MSIRKLNIIWCSLVVIIVAVGTIYHITWEKKQTVMDDPLHWFKSEQEAINYAKETNRPEI